MSLSCPIRNAKNMNIWKTVRSEEGASKSPVELYGPQAVRLKADHRVDE